MEKYLDNRRVDPVDEIYRRSNTNNSQILHLLRKRIIGVWMNPVWQNSWNAAAAPYKPYRYTLLNDSFFMDSGVADGGSSGTIAFTVGELWRPFDGDIIWRGSVVGAGAAGAEFRMNYVTGEVTITF